MKLGVFLLIVFFMLLDYSYYSNLWSARKAQKAAETAKEIPLRLIQDQIADLRLHGSELPPCPLLFPLLDSKGRMTPLGGYLSELGMEQASYLPQSVLRLPDIGKIFEDFDLFVSDSPLHKIYKTELPLRFGAKDFGEGTWTKTYHGWRIHLRFWGTKPEKNYDQTFAKGDLHMAPGWIAASLQDYLGLKPTPDQAADRDQPVFADDADLLRAASLEPIFRSGGSILVTHWEKILAANPDNPDLVGRWVSILDARENKTHLDLEEASLQKFPASSLLRNLVERESILAGKYDEALRYLWDDLKRDDNNPALYALTACVLESQDHWPEAVQLLKTWTQLHPDNAQAWMDLAAALREQSNVIRVLGTDRTPNNPNEEILKQTLAQGLQAARQAAQIAPQDCRVWIALMGYGTDASFDKAAMDQYFEKAVQLNPYEYSAYVEYLHYLTPQKFDANDKAFAFAENYENLFPALLPEAAETALETSWSGGSTGASAIDKKRSMEDILNPDDWDDFEQSFQDNLQRHPADMAAWQEYLSWADVAGATNDALSFAQTLALSNSELKALPPYVVLFAEDAAQNNQATPAEKQAVASDPAWVEKMGAAYQTLLKWDDNNWRIWNLYALYCVTNHLTDEAKRAFTAVDDHVDNEVWTAKDFEKAKSDLGLESIPLPGAEPSPSMVTPQPTGIMASTTPHPISSASTEIPVPTTTPGMTATPISLPTPGPTAAL
jgi:hypothetical protein